MASELTYDAAIDNCANMPGCGAQRVLFTWFHMPAICCPRCYENLFGAAPEPASVITLPAATPATDDAPTQAEIDRCGWSEDPYHRCRVCHDYAAGRDREHRLTVAAVDPGRADQIAGNITAYAETAQEASRG